MLLHQYNLSILSAHVLPDPPSDWNLYDEYEAQITAILQFQPLHLQIPEVPRAAQLVLLPLQMYNVHPGNDHGLGSNHLRSAGLH